MRSSLFSGGKSLNFFLQHTQHAFFFFIIYKFTETFRESFSFVDDSLPSDLKDMLPEVLIISTTSPPSISER